MINRDRRLAALALLGLLALLPPTARARAESGTAVPDLTLPVLGGGKAPLLSTQVKANVVLFFRTGQERSTDALKQMAACEKEFSGKPIHWAAVVSSSEQPADVKAAVAESGIQMPVLVDEGDKLYDQLQIRMHPMIGIFDGQRRVAAMEPYRHINYCDVVKTRIRVLLGEATLADLEKALNPEQSPLPGTDPMKKALRDVNLARRYVELGDYELAVKQAGRALEVAPVGQAFVVMGEAYARMGKCKEALRALDQAARLDPKNPGIAQARSLCPP